MKYWFVFFLKCIYICRQVSPIPVCHFLPSRFFANSTGLFKEKNGFTFISTHATPLTAVVIGLCSELLHTCCEWRVFFLCFFFFFSIKQLKLQPHTGYLWNLLFLWSALCEWGRTAAGLCRCKGGNSAMVSPNSRAALVWSGQRREGGLQI